MASEKNLNAVFTDIANAIRGKKGTTEQFQPINMADEIANLPSGGGGSLKTLLDATKSCYYLFYGYKGTSVEGLISYSDTSSVTNMNNMFNYCSSLTTITQLDTSKVTDMYQMFYQCSKLTAIPQLNTSSVINMRMMFYGCSSLTTIPKLNTSSVQNMQQMFTSCDKLTTIPQLDTSEVRDMSSMFQYCYELTTIPELNTSKVTNMNMMFYGCPLLTMIPQFDVSRVTDLGNMVGGCTSLKSILMTGIKANFNISSSTQFEESDLVTILNNLATVTSTKTLTMGATNLAKLTDEEKAIATNKGWTLK